MGLSRSSWILVIVVTTHASCGTHGERGAPPDPKCDGDCGALGDRLERGDGVARDYLAAASAYRNACNGSPGDGEACWRLAKLANRERGITLDPQSVLALIERACTLGHIASCGSLLVMAPDRYIENGSEWNPRLRQACASGDADACDVQVTISAMGAIVAQDGSGFDDELASACRLGSVQSCEMLLRDEGKLAVEARRAMSLACDRGVADACALVPGREIPSATLCAAGDRGACKRAGR